MSRDSGISQERKPQPQPQPTVVKFEGNGQEMGHVRKEGAFFPHAVEAVFVWTRLQVLSVG